MSRHTERHYLARVIGDGRVFYGVFDSRLDEPHGWAMTSPQLLSCWWGEVENQRATDNNHLHYYIPLCYTPIASLYPTLSQTTPTQHRNHASSILRRR